MRNRMIIGGFVAMALLLAASTASAQAATAAKPAKASLDQEIKLLRQDVRTEKSRIMLSGLELNADQTAKFLPIYKEFDRDLAKLNDLREASIRDYAKSYNTMSDNKADQLVNQAISYYKKRTDLLASYYDKVRAALGTGIAARFVQIEAMLNNIIDLQIQSSLPLIATPSSG